MYSCLWLLSSAIVSVIYIALAVGIFSGTVWLVRRMLDLNRDTCKKPESSSDFTLIVGVPQGLVPVAPERAGELARSKESTITLDTCDVELPEGYDLGNGAVIDRDLLISLPDELVCERAGVRYKGYIINPSYIAYSKDELELEIATSAPDGTWTWNRFVTDDVKLDTLKLIFALNQLAGYEAKRRGGFVIGEPDSGIDMQGVKVKGLRR